jgi:uncharacterized membrane protein
VRPGIALLFLGCTAPAELADEPCPPGGTALTYANFGADFLAEHCNTCHATGADGAPAAYRFDSPEQVRDLADRIFIRAAGPNVTMPPGPDDPPGEQREQLAEWLACGAP